MSQLLQQRDEGLPRSGAITRTFVPYASENRLLMALPENETVLIAPWLQMIQLRFNERIIEANRPISHLYFLESGWASVMSTGRMRPVEIAMIGCEGAVGISAILGASLAVNNCLMQSAGHGWRLEPERLFALLPTLPVLEHRLKDYVHRRLLQSYDAIVANTIGSLSARVARAILMCHDRSKGNELSITQDQLARKVGANRAGVTTALHILEGQRIIQSKRRRIVVCNRDRLEEASDGTYSRATVR